MLTCSPHRVIVAALLASTAACPTARPSELPRDEAWLVAVKSCRLPTWMDWYTRFAHHTWIDVKAGDEEHWRRIEVPAETSGVVIDALTPSQARADWRWSGREVRVLATVRGEHARSISERIDAAALQYDELFEHAYRAWPGPNSNTLLRWLTRDLPELVFPFDHNALGKDFVLRAGLTPSRTGVSFDAYLIGVAFALDEGLEFHVLGLTFGLQFEPLRLQLPFLPELPWPSAPRELQARTTSK